MIPSGLTRSLTYNTAIDRFVAVGALVNVDVPGFYFSVAEDLVDWSAPSLLMATDLRQTAADGEAFLAYPSIIDPDDASRNLERPDGDALLYYTRFNNTFGPAITLSPNKDTDLLRVPITVTAK